MRSPDRRREHRGVWRMPWRIRVVAGLACLVILAGGAGRSVSAGGDRALVAVFPVENLSGGVAPVEDIRRLLIDHVVSRGVAVLDDPSLDGFITRHRIRYAAGLDTPTAASLRQETGVERAVFASLSLSSYAVPPKVALVVKLVSTSDVPVVIWADDVGMAGDDSPGLFELGVVNDYQVLLNRAVGRLTDSMVDYLERGRASGGRAASKFKPKAAFRALSLAPGRTYSVAVLPFVNLSGRRNAGDVLASLFVRHLAGLAPFRVVDLGVTRRQLLDARIIMNDGPSISDAETVAALLDADFVLGGRVLRYQDYEGPAGRTGVEFSAVVIERRSRRVVWSSDSYNEGGDGVVLFEWGMSRTAHSMATQMARIAAEMMAGRDR